MELLKTALLLAFTITLISLSIPQKHLMLAPICLETIILVLFTIIVILSSSSITLSQIPLSTILLTISVCGADVGLSLVVTITRTHGSDFLNHLNLP